MTFSELGSLGEFISSLAVVASLIFIALQVRQSSDSSRIASRQSVLEASRNMMGLYSSKEYVEISVKSSKVGFDGLSEVEQGQYKLMRGAQLRNIENAFLLKEDGVLDSEVFHDTFDIRARGVLREWPQIVDDYSGTKAFMGWLEELRSDENDA